MSVTIDDVAKHAGVSTATVSRYLNSSPLIAKKSAEKVQKSMEELNYQPNFVARSLASHSTSTIAFIIDSTNTETYGNDYFLRIQYGIEATLGKQGYYLLIINVENNETGESNLRKLVLEKRVEGIILPKALAKESILTMLREAALPFVVIGRSDSAEYNWIDLDNAMGGHLATKQLLNSGSKTVALLSSSFEKSFARERFDGYREALKSSNAAYDESQSILGCMNAEDGEEAVHRLLRSLPGLDGIVCTDNVVAFGAARALMAAGKKIPQDVQIITFDNTFVTELSIPKLSVADVDVSLLGREAAGILLATIEHPSEIVQNKLLPVSLVLRDSTR